MRLGTARAHAGRAAALLLVAVSYAAARLPEATSAQRAELARRFRFAHFTLPETPAGPTAVVRRVRPVHPRLAHYAAWISSVGAAVALADLDGDGLANDACLVDVRDDTVVVTPLPGVVPRPRPYHPFVLTRPARADGTAPMGCLPADLDEDGFADLIVYSWGRTPRAFLHVPRATAALQRADYEERELIPGGGRWYTNALTRADLDGDGHADLVVGNYFPDGAGVLDADAAAGAAPEMQDSMSRAWNGGRNRLLLCRPSATQRVACRDASDALEPQVAHGWTLAAAAADLDGDLLPELYFANDFGPDRLLHNRSWPGRPRFATLAGRRTLTTPASKVLGRDSFKGMGADFGDVDGDGRLDLYVSNIAASFALEESHFLFVADGDARLMAAGRAPFTDRSEPLGLSRSDWAWDARLDDFDNDGHVEAVQALGFLRGDSDRWPELHELAMGNDLLLRRPAVWPRFAAGDDLSGARSLAFFTRGDGARFTDVAGELGLDHGAVTRGVATADVDGDGDLDLALAGQWGDASFHRNDLPQPRSFLALRLLVCRAASAPARSQARRGPIAGDGPCRPAIGATARVVVPRRGAAPRVLVAQVDGGNGHSGKRSPDLHFGLGATPFDAPLRVELRWRDDDGRAAFEALELRPGWHTLRLARAATEAR